MRRLIAAAMLAVPAPAIACGGIFCSPAPQAPGPPVVQAAERIVFAVDGAEIEAHVQIFYEGDPIDFAWVVPVPSEPELLLGSDALFDVLAAQTRPEFIVTFEETGDCVGSSGCNGGVGGRRTSFAPNDMAFDSDFADTGYWNEDVDDGVDIIQQSQVGPFETVTLKADTAEDLLTWLQDNDYQLPDDLDPVLAPYVAGNSYFVALRLQNDAGTGAIEPLVMRYQGEKGMIPITLTSIAAAEDMALEVYIFGDHRAVPENYLHVEVNPAAIDWLSAGANYFDVVTRAVDAAGGKAWVTDFAGSPAYLEGQVRLAAGSINAMSDEENDAVLRAEDLLEMPMLTRMSTSMSPIDMDMDPLFVLNSDMPNVSRTQLATVTWDCRGPRTYSDAYREIALPDGSVQLMPSTSDASDSAGYLAAYDVPALRIERTGRTGEPELQADNAAAAQTELKRHNSDVRAIVRTRPGPGVGCSISSTPARFAAAWLVLALAFMRRRHLATGDAS